ncbi:3-isopropylmalate dehydratase small subunit [Mesorhizobium sp. CAU 1741]|uniref:3-isopropylmalate dehydratase small subunit n=1 Tax=Mesorhizobium sp. CAU 1741 TaxID=3140366 RepID=UPI00325AD268
MRAFTAHEGIAAPLRLDDVNTDVIIPTNRAIHVAKGSLGRFAFEPLRYDEGGRERADFVLNQYRYAGASILVAGANFGCGSSREMAAWALDDAGIRCVIAPSFGDIFFQNCCKIGLLALTLPDDTVENVWDELARAATPRMSVDLSALRVTAPEGTRYTFGFDEGRRDALLHGLDDIGQTLRHADAIARFVTTDRYARPWNYLPAPGPASHIHSEKTDT